MAIISYDEKPGIQAIATTAPDLPPEPGVHKTFARDHEYERKGTVSLLAGIDLRLLDVSNGFEEIVEWGGEQVDDGDVGCGVSVSSSTGPCGLKDAVQAFEAGVGVG